jgi:4-amino-4-deoxy-L-arabinose transferase-like glycosyltransferase
MWWLIPALISLFLAIIFRDPFAGDWDALDYTVLALRGEPSSMILGRTLFIYTNHALWLTAHSLFNLQPEHAYLLFKGAVIVETPLVIIAWWTLARDLTNNVRAATIAALLIASSPLFIMYSGQAMTEIPSLLLLAVALTIHLRGLRRRSLLMTLAGAALLGLGVNVREAAILYGPWLVLAPLVVNSKFRWRELPSRKLWIELLRGELLTTALACLVFFICAFAPFAYFYLLDVDNYQKAWHGWAESTRIESARHPPSFGNFRILLLNFFIACPLLLGGFLPSVIHEWRRRGFTPLILLAVVGLLANLSLIIHYSVVLNARYVLTGLPALAPMVAAYFVQEQEAKMKNGGRAFANVALGVAVVGLWLGANWWPSNEGYIQSRALTKNYNAQLAHIPRDAVVMAGGQTVGVTYWRGLGMGDWEVIGSGGGWPGAQLGDVIENYLHDHRRVFLDADARWWSPCGWQILELRELAGIESRFHFQRVADTLYEIKPLEDETARDHPQLQSLLPEHRPEQVKYCSQ